jgi:hypothetical protein
MAMAWHASFVLPHRDLRPILTPALTFSRIYLIVFRAALSSECGARSDVRDRALLPLGFAGALRRSDIAALGVGYLTFVLG